MSGADFQNKIVFLRMTFKCEADINEDINTTFEHPQGGQIGGTIPLSDRQKDVISLIISNPKISRLDIAKELNINQSAVIKHLDNLKSMGILARIGGTRGYWVINQ